MVYCVCVGRDVSLKLFLKIGVHSDFLCGLRWNVGCNGCLCP